MITKTLLFLERGIQYVRAHPNIILTLALVLVIPLAFAWSALTFLDVSETNQSRLEFDRIGLLHDTFLSLLWQTHADPQALQREIERISSLNPDIVVFRVTEKTFDGYVPIAARNTEVIGVAESDEQIYNLAFANPNESIVQSIRSGEERFIRGVRLAEFDDREFFILTLTSRAAVDDLFQKREQTAWLWMLVLLSVVMVLVVRHVRLIDYGFLYREARNAIKTKDLFTNMIAHELRAPLTAMRGYASMIVESKTAAESEREYALRIMKSSERLLAIVNDLLDVARIQSGRLKIEKRPADLSKIVTTVLDELRSTALEKSISLQQIGFDGPHEIETDEKRLHQALTNIVSNALKYTKHGSIEVSLEVKPTVFELRVKDTGMGISAEDQQKLFAPFFRVESADVRTVTGTGLGMWITKELIELMDHKIGVESIKGVGTHVVISLPKLPD